MYVQKTQKNLISTSIEYRVYIKSNEPDLHLFVNRLTGWMTSKRLCLPCGSQHSPL